MFDPDPFLALAIAVILRAIFTAHAAMMMAPSGGEIVPVVPGDHQHVPPALEAPQPVIAGPNLDPAGSPIPQPAAVPANPENPGRVARDKCFWAVLGSLLKELIKYFFSG